MRAAIPYFGDPEGRLPEVGTAAGRQQGENAGDVEVLPDLVVWTIRRIWSSRPPRTESATNEQLRGAH